MPIHSITEIYPTVFLRCSLYTTRVALRESFAAFNLLRGAIDIDHTYLWQRFHQRINTSITKQKDFVSDPVVHLSASPPSPSWNTRCKDCRAIVSWTRNGVSPTAIWSNLAKHHNTRATGANNNTKKRNRGPIVRIRRFGESLNVLLGSNSANTNTNGVNRMETSSSVFWSALFGWQAQCKRS